MFLGFSSIGYAGLHIVFIAYRVRTSTLNSSDFCSQRYNKQVDEQAFKDLKSVVCDRLQRIGKSCAACPTSCGGGSGGGAGGGSGGGNSGWTKMMSWFRLYLSKRVFFPSSISTRSIFYLWNMICEGIRVMVYSEMKDLTYTTPKICFSRPYHWKFFFDDTVYTVCSQSSAGTPCRNRP